MDSNKPFSKVSVILFLVIFCDKVCSYDTSRVKKHGDNAHEKFYDINSLLDSWQEACQSESGGIVSVPDGTFQLDPIEFEGPCKNQVTFQLDGTLQAPTGIINGDDWIKFHNIDGLIIQGSGTLDGQGASAWQDKCPSCPPLTTSLTLSSVTNAQVTGITSLNSKGYHIKVNKGGGTTIEHVTITAPEDSPNTDGIHTSEANNINILNSDIGTGDDCISIGEGTQNINITGINCGPGHGISIGSIGKNADDGSVSGVHVMSCTMTSTENGVRIKTWTSDCSATVSDVTFHDITIDQASNPIIIDQQYCGGSHECGSLLDSWQEACQSESGGIVSVPDGTFQLDPIEFEGPCKNQVTFQLDGTLQAPTGIINGDDWIKFHNIDGLIIQGSGTLDGQGASAWQDKCPSCPPLTTSLTLSSVTNAQVTGITSLNSKGYHIKVNKGGGTTIEHVTITAPEDSPNTDGIHTSEANNINILNSDIGTGDDCISIGEGTQNINITGINCGPGHGISIGSIGKNADDGSVSGVHVMSCTMTSTENGVRIKTWTSDCSATVSDVTFHDITIDQASNPIIIDQQYCGGSHECGFYNAMSRN
uniref:Polygalacturonase n=1 Tax=Daucus carota subsp. sativus TaxID=79200 RepID=A0A162AH31_DAUCS